MPGIDSVNRSLPNNPVQLDNQTLSVSESKLNIAPGTDSNPKLSSSLHFTTVEPTPLAQRKVIPKQDKLALVEAYAQLKSLSHQARILADNLDQSDARIIARGVSTILLDLSVMAINYGMTFVVPALPVASPVIAGASATLAGEVTNKLLQLGVGQVLNPDLSRQLDTGHIEKRHETVQSAVVDEAREWGLALAHSNTFVGGVAELLMGNKITDTIDATSKLVYFKGDLARKAWASIKLAEGLLNNITKKLEGLLEAHGEQTIKVTPSLRLSAMWHGTKTPGITTLSVTPKDLQTISTKAKERLARLEDISYRVGYPVGWLIRNNPDKSKAQEAVPENQVNNSPQQVLQDFEKDFLQCLEQHLEQASAGVTESLTARVKTDEERKLLSSLDRTSQVFGEHSKHYKKEKLELLKIINSRESIERHEALVEDLKDLKQRKDQARADFFAEK